VSLRLESNYCLSINDNKLRLFFSTTWLRGCKVNCDCLEQTKGRQHRTSFLPSIIPSEAEQSHHVCS
jgi:hypothetical protein